MPAMGRKRASGCGGRNEKRKWKRERDVVVCSRGQRVKRGLRFPTRALPLKLALRFFFGRRKRKCPMIHLCHITFFSVSESLLFFFLLCTPLARMSRFLFFSPLRVFPLHPFFFLFFLGSIQNFPLFCVIFLTFILQVYSLRSNLLFPVVPPRPPFSALPPTTTLPPPLHT